MAIETEGMKTRCPSQQFWNRHLNSRKGELFKNSDYFLCFCKYYFTIVKWVRRGHLIEAAVVAAALQVHYATQGQQHEERYWKVGKEGQRPSEQIWGQEQKKTWSKGTVRDKLNNLVSFDKATYDKLCKEVPNYKLIASCCLWETAYLWCLGQGSPSGAP